MAVKLRLRRLGAKGAPYYHIVAADARSPRDGKFLEQIGSYDPTRQPAEIVVNHDSAIKWLKNGAQATETVNAILRYTGVNLKYALIKQGKDAETVEKMYTAWVAKKHSDIANYKDSLSKKKSDAEAARLERETKIRAAKAAAIVAKNTPPPAEEPVSEGGGESTEAPAEN
jgi:small subunit ribosomal protein S16